MKGRSIWDSSEHEFMVESRKLLKAMAEKGHHIPNAFVDEETGKLVVDTDEGTIYELQQLIGEGEFMMNVSDVTLKVPKMSGWGFDPDTKSGSCVHYFRAEHSLCGDSRRPDKLYRYEEIDCMNDGSIEGPEVVFCEECCVEALLLNTICPKCGKEMEYNEHGYSDDFTEYHEYYRCTCVRPNLSRKLTFKLVTNELEE